MNEDTTLSLIDTALASGSAAALDPEERKLQELVLALRDDAPSPASDFALRMDAKVAAGFPARRTGLSGTRARLRAFTLARPKLVAGSAAASLLVGLAVVSGLTGGGSGDSSSGSVAAGGGSTASQAAPETGSAGSNGLAAPMTAQKAAPSASDEAARSAAGAPAGGVTSADSVAVSPPITPSPGGFVGGGNRRVERSAALELSTTKDKLDDLGNDVLRVSDRYRGIVMRSSITQAGDKGSSIGSYDLRIPVRSLPAALRDLSALATVESRTENADDLTASFVSARTRLQELNAERRGLLRRLELATTDQATAAIRSRIRIVNAQIQAQMNTVQEMRRRTSYAAVSVTLTTRESSGGSGGLGDGARDLRNSLVDAANIALRVLGVALPIGLVLAIMWLIGGRFNRRRREAVLD